MGHIFQDEWWVGHPSGYSCGFLWLRKLAKAMTKALERKMTFLAHLVMKILEITRKGR